MEEQIKKRRFIDYLRSRDMWFIAIVVAISLLIARLLSPMIFHECDSFLQRVIIEIGIMTPIILVVSSTARVIMKRKNKK